MGKHELRCLQRILGPEAALGVSGEVDHQLHGLLARGGVLSVQRQLSICGELPERHPPFRPLGTRYPAVTGDVSA